MKKATMIAAVAAIAAPSFALAGSNADPVMEEDVFVETTPAPAGSSAGSLGSANAGTAIAVGLLAAAAIAAADGS